MTEGIDFREQRNFDAQELFRAFEAYSMRMDQASLDISALTDEANERMLEAIQAKALYVKKKAVEFINAEGSVEARKRISESLSVEAMRDKEVAEANAAWARDRMFNKKEDLKSLRSRMSAFQSVGSMARIEAEILLSMKT